jgi:hypothetical protein
LRKPPTVRNLGILTVDEEAEVALYEPSTTDLSKRMLFQCLTWVNYDGAMAGASETVVPRGRGGSGGVSLGSGRGGGTRESTRVLTRR